MDGRCGCGRAPSGLVLRDTAAGERPPAAARPAVDHRHFELWRLFSYMLVGSGGLGGLFSTVFSLAVLGGTLGTKLEQALGSLRFFTLTLLTCSVAAFLFVFIALALEALFPASGAMLWAAGGGPWGLVVSWSAVESRLYPGETRRLFFLPWDIPARMYPVALAVLIVLFGMGGGGQGGGAFLGIPVALLAGFLFAEEDYNELEPSRQQGAFLRFLAPSTTRLQQWESSSLCAWLVNMDGYVRVGNALGRRAYDASTTSRREHHFQRTGRRWAGAGPAVTTGGGTGSSAESSTSQRARASGLGEYHPQERAIPPCPQIRWRELRVGAPW